MPAPTLTDVKAYLGDDASWDDAAISSALASEKAAQKAACKVPADEDPFFPADLAEALFRRVAHNLALRSLPLGVQASITDSAVATNRVGGTDAEVRRLEAPHRRLAVY